MDIELTQPAQARIREIVAAAGKAGLRLSVKEAGCSGLEYVMDTVDGPAAGDIEAAFDGFTLYVDAESYTRALTGLRLDFQKDMLSSAFVYNNPNQKGSCGCGVSFSV
ncbi:iron-sulfur cluster assembly protein [Mariprofundus ferrinatatus]|uniref:Iron-sulfur cluster assembly protein n=1 Tax=Mariprofundus ferrinatatus TaxID=1921087 RepID=A0A2K8L1Q2_9PROT|nr:iron-sulfur cluster assembly accessory protein [Mariprofundus ferrinatatus]ATX81173.1 iron-sulfur cluster assembly protein [Mariprofundus ferrinatatus]